LRPDVAVEEREVARLLDQRVSELAQELAPREARVLEERLLADSPRSLREVGAEVSLSGERVRQIEHRLVDELRARVLPLAA
jgi:RNA polymerase sigma-32 factor